MDAKMSCISAVLTLLLLVQNVSADYLNTLFGTTLDDDNTVLYVTIGFFVLTIVLFVCMIICLYWLHKMIKERIKKRQEQLVMEEKQRWRGGVDDIIDDAHRMVPLPRAANTLEKGYTNGAYSNGGIDFVNSRI